MSSEVVRRAADLLLRAREEVTTLPTDAVGFPLAGAADAYAVQALVAAEVGTVGAWKVGASSPEAAPIFAPIFADLVHESPARLEGAAFHRRGIEAEIAYRLGRDLPARSEPYTRAEVVEAIAAVLPAIEIVDSRLAGFEQQDPWWKLADNQVNGALVVGPALADWERIDPMTQPVRLMVDGEVVAAGEGGNTAGDPLRLLVWMANHVGAHCGGLRAGQIVTTGSLTGVRFVAPGAHVVAELAGLGIAEVIFAA
jgi:2-keto-4-pentenoate hydratase